MGIVSRGSERTVPNVQILGVDEHYLNVSGIPLLKGRGFTKSEAEDGAPLIVIGTKWLVLLRMGRTRPDILQENVLVIGVLEPRGDKFGMSQDNQCLVSIPTARRQFSDNTVVTE